jgi:hypothetical protein
LDKSEGQSLEDAIADRAGLFSSRGVSALVSPNSGDPPVNFMAQEKLEHERSLRSSRVVEGGDDTHERMAIVHQQLANQWLIRLQPEIVPSGSLFEIKKKKERLKDLRHYLNQNWRSANAVLQVRDLGPGLARDQVIKDFWISCYNGSFYMDHEELQRRGWVLAEFLALRDQYEESESDISSTSASNTYIQAMRRSSAVSGMSVLALE